MTLFISSNLVRATALVSILLLCGSNAFAQSGTGRLYGTVTDPSGAAVTNATVIAIGPDGQAKTATTSRTGSYEITGLAPGTYTLTVDAAGFASYAKDQVEVIGGESRLANIALSIAVEKEKVDVTEQETGVDTNPADNTGAIILSGKDLDALPDDPDELQTDLEALAGPSAGPNGGQIYIDGFTGGQLPPKSSIREIRINQNPFSAEYDKLGYGRIEIFTKPGTDKYHGQISVMGNSSAFNSQNPFLEGDEPSYHSLQYMGNVGGPISQKASFFLDVQRRNIDEVAVVNATVPNPEEPCFDPSCPGLPFSTAVPNPHTRTNIGPRLDFQITKNNTLTTRYQYFHDTEENDNVGQLFLPTQGAHTLSTEHTFQISDTQVLSAKVVNETHFQYLRENNREIPVSTDPKVTVLGSFTGGGSSAGTSTDREDHYELQNYTSMALGSHVVKFGGRLRLTHAEELSTTNFNGTWTFQDLAAFQADPPDAFQFSINSVPGATTTVIPTVTANVVDAGLYVQDDWRVRSNLTVSAGLRFETQNAIGDHGDWAPRVSVAWGIGGGQKSAAKTVLRAGFGMFYERLTEPSVMQAERLNGVTQLQYIATANLHYPTIPSPDELQASSPTTYQIDPRFRAPYILQTAVSLERQVSKTITVTASYLNSRGFRQLLTRNINAPLPGTFDPGDPASGVRPDGTSNNIYQYESEGVFRQNQLIANANIRAGARLSLFGYYTLNNVHSNVSSSGGFPSNQYDLDQDYGRPTYDIRHRVFFGGSISLPYGFRASPFMIASSGVPYNVTIGTDYNGDSLFNDRPAFATPTSEHVVPTQFGAFDIQPKPGQPPVPINYLTGPAQFTLNLRLSKTFGFGRETGAGANQSGAGGGPSPGGGGHGGGHGPGGGSGGFGGGPRAGMGAIFGPGTTNRRYNLTLSVNARNVLNRVNLAPPIGNLSSPSFGESISLAGGPFSSAAANRKLELQASFSF